MNLLTVNNPKIEKGRKMGYLTGILHLAPSRLSGYNVCPMASPNCEAVCLNIAGRGGMFAGEHTTELTGAQMLAKIKMGALQNRIQAARIRRTKLYFENRPRFRMMLAEDIFKVRKIAAKHNLIPAIRLNGTSDIRWELETIIQQNSDIQFYDYTKIANRRDIPKNYHLTFSRSENNNWREAFENGMNVAVVFRKELPSEWEGIRVVSGDETDLRFLDPKGVIVGLKAKGKAKKDESGFVV